MTPRQVKVKRDALPAAVHLVSTPITLPPRRRVGGQYVDVLKQALGLKKTSEETGLSPHMEWNCETHRELKRVLGGLVAARRRNGDRFEHVLIRSHSNQDDKRFLVYIWHQE